MATPSGDAPASAGAGAFERLLFNHSPDGMLVIRVERKAVDELCFHIAAENPAALARLGAYGQTTTFAGQDIETALPAWLVRQAKAQYKACVESRETRRYEITQPGTALTHESIATPILEDGKTVNLIVVTMRDIRDRALHERELNAALAKAERAIRSKSEFFASMSHELRTPLNAIIGFSDMMEKGIGGSLSDRHRQYVDHIHSSGQHLLGIISDILDLSKIEAGQFKLRESEVSLAPLAETCLKMVEERAQIKSLTLGLDIAADMPAILADPIRIKQILLNLLSNAVKFTEHGSVTLSMRFDATEGFALSVTDTGIGMTADELKVALEPFGQVEDAYCRNNEGTGLGLPIARHLIELHSGRLELKSKKGTGTSVIATLPAARAVSSAAEIAAAS